MDNRNTDEDEIDTETLQAQIDLSMSFAQHLVSSWIKQPRKLSNRNRDVETELEEYMRRPPRLGVGAPIPETRSLTREAARLKGHLTGKGTKRSRDDDEDVTKGKAECSDEESRAGAIKKKVRLDQSRDGDGKKKGKRRMAPSESTSSTSAPPVPGPSDAEMSELAEVLGMVTETDVTDAQGAAVSSLKHNPSAMQSVNEIQAPPVEPACSNSPNATDWTNHNTHDEAPAKNFLPRSPNAQLRSLSFQPADILKHPVLNLDPPSSDDNSDQEAGPEAPATPSPKKKRKRRKKKKKNPQVVDVTMTTESNAVV